MGRILITGRAAHPSAPLEHAVSALGCGLLGDWHRCFPRIAIQWTSVGRCGLAAVPGRDLGDPHCGRALLLCSKSLDERTCAQRRVCRGFPTTCARSDEPDKS